MSPDATPPSPESPGLTGDGDLRVNQDLLVPASELEWRFSRAGGPGGQHVNKTASRAELVWNVKASAVPTERQRSILCDRLASRLDADGSLRISTAEHRSQHRNRGAAADRMAALLAAALQPRKRRRATRPTLASKRRRIDAKRRRGQKKADRRSPRDW